MDSNQNRIKTILLMFTSLSLIISISTLSIVVAIKIMFISEGVYELNLSVRNPALSAISVISCISVVHLFGWIGTYKDSKILLKIYGFMVLLGIVIQCSILIYIVVFSGNLYDRLTNYYQNHIKKYNYNLIDTLIVDTFQSQMNCCGASNFLDWEGHDDFKCSTNIGYNSLSITDDKYCGVPWSCCIVNRQNNSTESVKGECGVKIFILPIEEQEKLIYTQGCTSTFFRLAYSTNKMVSAGILITLFIIMQLILTVLIVKRIDYVRFLDQNRLERTRMNKDLQI